MHEPLPYGGDFFLHQKYDSQAIYGNVGFHLTDAFRIAAGVRQTEDDKSADTEPVVGVIGASNSNDGRRPPGTSRPRTNSLTG